MHCGSLAYSGLAVAPMNALQHSSSNMLHTRGINDDGNKQNKIVQPLILGRLSCLVLPLQTNDHNVHVKTATAQPRLASDTPLPYMAACRL
jgi:hypothetical protein